LNARSWCSKRTSPSNMFGYFFVILNIICWVLRRHLLRPTSVGIYHFWLGEYFTGQFSVGLVSQLIVWHAWNYVCQIVFMLQLRVESCSTTMPCATDSKPYSRLIISTYKVCAVKKLWHFYFYDYLVNVDRFE